MAVRESNFEIAALEAAEPVVDEELLDAKIAPGVYIMFRRPTQGEFALYTLSFGRRSSGREVLPRMDEFLRKIVLTTDEVAKIEGFEERDDFVDSEWLWDRVADRAYPEFTVMTLNEIIGKVVESFGGFPTQSSSNSTGSQKAPGTSSTAPSRRVGSTRSR